MKCPRCDFEVKIKDNYCPYCGEPLRLITTSKDDNLNYRDNEFENEDIEQNKLVAAFSYFSFLFILYFIVCPKSKFAKFHANQGIILLITKSIVSLVIVLLEISIAYQNILDNICDGVFVLLMMYGLINALKGKAKRLPIIGKYNILK